jgi:hypothetical protein
MRVLLLALLFILPVCAYEDVPACFRKLETQFFTEKNVMDALESFYIYQSQWVPIWTDLARRTKDAVPMIRDRAKKERKNPLEHPFNAKRAKEILLEVQREIFVKTLNAWRIWDERTINGMFANIQEDNKKRLEECK